MIYCWDSFSILFYNFKFEFEIFITLSLYSERFKSLADPKDLTFFTSNLEASEFKTTNLFSPF